RAKISLLRLDDRRLETRLVEEQALRIFEVAAPESDLDLSTALAARRGRLREARCASEGGGSEQARGETGDEDGSAQRKPRLFGSREGNIHRQNRVLARKTRRRGRCRAAASLRLFSWQMEPR